MLQRNISRRVSQALEDSPITLIHGARQTGKTTLARAFTNGRNFVDFDDVSNVASARQNPKGFVDGLAEEVVLDEIQRVPEIILPIKSSVDRNRRPGRFLLTGSAHVLMLPNLADSLAGRMEIVSLWPLSQGELAGREDRFLDRLLDEDADLSPTGAKDDPWERILVGGFPDALQRPTLERRQNWFSSYVTSIIERDVRDVNEVQNLHDLPRLLQLLATRIGSLLNYSDVSRSLSIPHSTLRRHFALFQAVFMVRLLSPWSTNLGTRLVKSPKLYFLDTGLVSALLSIDRERIQRESALAGSLMENFVVMELTKQATWNRSHPQLFHFRSRTGTEVDVIAEAPDGRVAAVEIKSSASVSSGDFRGIRALSDLVGKRFVRGVVLYTGDQTVPFGDKLFAVPLHALWSA